MTTAAVTGAAGFVGRHLVDALLADGTTMVRALVRTAEQAESLRAAVAACRPDAQARLEPRIAGDLVDAPDLAAHLDGADAVYHLAARVHVLRETAADPDAAFLRANRDATERLARAAAAAGVRRFITTSTVKVHGEASGGTPLTEAEPPAPADAYARSKLAAEAVLCTLADACALETVIVRPPLVYGPGVGGNFAALLRWVARGVPLPLGSVRNRRSLLGVSNLADLLVRCATHPAAANEVFLAADGDDVSTPELLRRAGAALGRPARLWPCPPGLLRLAATCAGRRAAVDRLLGDYRISPGKAADRLGWTPPVSMERELERTAAWFRSAS